MANRDEDRPTWFLTRSGWFEMSRIRDEERRISLPPKLEIQGVVSREGNVCWGYDIELESVFVCRYEKDVDESETLESIGTRSVQDTLSVNVPAEFFESFTPPQTGVAREMIRRERQPPDTYRFHYGQVCHFVSTSYDVNERKLCYVVPNERLDQMVAAAGMYRDLAAKKWGVDEENGEMENDREDDAASEPA